MSISYHCPHLSDPHAPHSHSNPSSSYSFFPLKELYFCEECDAVRCDQCVAVEVASYFCPNCLFDVPSANVRADRNRCARSCFACPLCCSSLGIVPSDPSSSSSAAGSDGIGLYTAGGAPYILSCPGCKWTSREIGWEFEKPTGLALQLQKFYTAPEKVQSEFDAIKDHLESYITSSTSHSAKASTSKTPSRHISHLTQMASKALQRDLPSMAASTARHRKGRGDGSKEKERVGWDEISDYGGKEDWRNGVPNTSGGAEDEGEVADLEMRWANSWEGARNTKSMIPQRIPLQPKLTKRCPHPTCRHLLIQPDTKSARVKIKMVALSYLPVIEVGRRRRRVISEDSVTGVEETEEEREKRRKERRKTRGAQEFDEDLPSVLLPGSLYTFQIAFSNPLFDPIQIRLSQPPSQSSHKLFIPTPHFTVSALKDAWAYEEEEEEVEDPDDQPSVSGEGASTVDSGSQSRRSRLSIIGTQATGGAGGSLRPTKPRDTGIEKRGNISKVQVELEVGDSSGRVEFDLEFRYTYRAEAEGEEGKEGSHGEGEKEKVDKDEFKTFIFWIRVNLGRVA